MSYYRVNFGVVAYEKNRLVYSVQQVRLLAVRLEKPLRPLRLVHISVPSPLLITSFSQMYYCWVVSWKFKHIRATRTYACNVHIQNEQLQHFIVWIASARMRAHAITKATLAAKCTQRNVARCRSMNKALGGANAVTYTRAYSLLNINNQWARE